MKLNPDDRVRWYRNQQRKGTVYDCESADHAYVIWDEPVHPSDPPGLACRTYVGHLRLIHPLQQLADCAE